MGMTPDDMAVWDFDQPQGGLTKEEIRRAKIILWKGFCSVHQMFRPEHIRAFRENIPMVLLFPTRNVARKYALCPMKSVPRNTSLKPSPPPRLTLAGLSAPSSIWCNESPKNSSHRGKLSNSCRRLFACAARWRALTRNIWLGV